MGRPVSEFVFLGVPVNCVGIGIRVWAQFFGRYRVAGLRSRAGVRRRSKWLFWASKRARASSPRPSRYDAVPATRERSARVGVLSPR
eukprot:9017097-Lingulodinium_polyedra.AAC.1